ncbi:hypothetical protein Hanom_Chr14g01254681 [Helianthus anomalus]
MSMLWAPSNPRGVSVYGIRTKVKFCCLFPFALVCLCVGIFIKILFAAYGLINALDSKVGGEMVTRLLPKRELPWLEQIKDYFHHPMAESLSAHVATPTCAHPLVSMKPKAMKSPARGETILLSSEEITASSDGLIHRSRTTHIGPNVMPPGGSEAAAHTEPATMDPDVAADETV